MKKLFLERLEHMQIPVNNLAESIEWYTKNLGFTLNKKSEDLNHAFLSLPNGPMLMLWETGDDTAANFTFNEEVMPILLYHSKKIHELTHHLHSLHVNITFFQDEGFGWVLKFIDINGNMWGVIQLI